MLYPVFVRKARATLVRLHPFSLIISCRSALSFARVPSLAAMSMTYSYYHGHAPQINCYLMAAVRARPRYEDPFVKKRGTLWHPCTSISVPGLLDHSDSPHQHLLILIEARQSTRREMPSSKHRSGSIYRNFWRRKFNVQWFEIVMIPSVP
ncbi:hypothetical protein BC826DRAFT_87586 [Russula brevipes]|nr:hypothetical protein BC826DRAFT_87586 [Russula brevipes]